ncbi:MAG: phosphoenolpyruvate carboxykinase (ATP), partial [Planctomycetota bacterium]|nr:phosphoenolpyruvate carboxykinase (ATP) [Planctomycetota bacterium]
LVWHPSKYAKLLSENLRRHNTRVWLINTGWSGGAYGVGSRIKLSYTRSIIDAIHSGELADAPTQEDPVFRVATITQCAGVPSELLIPKNTWSDKSAFDATANKLAQLFTKSFTAYADGVRDEVRNAGPVAS